MSKESKLYKEVRIWGAKGRTDKWAPVHSGVVALGELGKYEVVAEEWDAWNGDDGKVVIISNDKVKSVTAGVKSYVRVKDRSQDNQGIET